MFIEHLQCGGGSPVAKTPFLSAAHSRGYVPTRSLLMSGSHTALWGRMETIPRFYFLGSEGNSVIVEQYGKGTFYVADTVLGTKDPVVNKTGEAPPLLGLPCRGENRKRNNINK